MKLVTSEQMREADRATMAAGTPETELIARAAGGLVNFIERNFSPLSAQRVVIVCGKGNNGADGLAAAKLLEGRVASLQVVKAEEPAVALYANATLVIDALLGTGFRGKVEGRYAELIADINTQFPHAKIVAVDIPSAMEVKADYTVTFAAPKAEMVMSPNASHAGRVTVVDIGISPSLLRPGIGVSEADDFAPLFQPRKLDGHKGLYGHVLVVGGAPGKTGSVAMTGMAALRMGAGLVTVACSDPSRLIPELMAQQLDLTKAMGAVDLKQASVLAIGPGLGVQKELVPKLLAEAKIPTVIDADALNSIAGTNFLGRGVETVLTPHPGEMARLAGAPVTDRLGTALKFAKEKNVCLVLKGYKTLIALPDGQSWINPTGSPSMAKGGTGDVLTGLTAGMIAQFPRDIPTAVRAAVWLHGRAGELAAQALTENCVLATDLLTFLPAAIREITP